MEEESWTLWNGPIYFWIAVSRGTEIRRSRLIFHFGILVKFLFLLFLYQILPWTTTYLGQLGMLEKLGVSTEYIFGGAHNRTPHTHHELVLARFIETFRLLKFC